MLILNTPEAVAKRFPAVAPYLRPRRAPKPTLDDLRARWDALVGSLRDPCGPDLDDEATIELIHLAHALKRRGVRLPDRPRLWLDAHAGWIRMDLHG
jgi:hypothetical protein